jgi:curli biogenesis system outer membrane secretion channel CsgG
MDFDYGTLTTQWWGQYDIGRGVATQLVYALVEDGRLRLIERSKLATVLGEQDFAASERASPEAAKLARVGKVLGVRYIVAGSITKFATSDRKFGGGTVGTVARGVLGPIGGLSFRKARQEVALTARFIDTTTGEIVASAQAEGVAKKGQGAAIEGGGPGGVGFGTESPEFKASGIAEAQALAVTTLSRELLAHVGELSAEPPKPDPTPPPPPPPAPAPAPAKARPARKAAPVAKPPTP